MMVWKSFYFDGESSASHGLFITGEAVYNAPRYDYDFVSIQGRNGDLILDNGRFENITVTYPCSLRDVSKLAEVRTWLYSKRGYMRLSDDYNANEYRMACVSEALNINPFHDSAADFIVTFNCKPQRFLVSGEQEYGNVIPAESNAQWTGRVRSPVLDGSGVVKLKAEGNVSDITNSACSIIEIVNAPSLPSNAATLWKNGEYVTLPAESNAFYYLYLNDSYNWKIKTDLITGTEEEYDVKPSEDVTNETAYDSAPIFIMRGKDSGHSASTPYAAQFTVNGVTIRVSRSYLDDHGGKDLYIDSEIQDCYYIDDAGNAQNANAYISLVNADGDEITDFPTFKAGNNVIRWLWDSPLNFAPLTAVSYIPRYFTI